MSNFNLNLIRTDIDIMKRFIWNCIYPDEVTIELFSAGDGEGPVWVHIIPLGDDPRLGEADVEITTNQPEYVTLEVVYDNYRRKDMTWAEWNKEIQHVTITSRYNDLVARGTQLFAQHSCPIPCSIAEADQNDSQVAPYQFRRFGIMWVAVYTTEGDMEIGFYPEWDGCDYIATLFANRDQPIKAMVLHGLGDSPVADEVLTVQLALTGEEILAFNNKMANLEEQIDQAEKNGNQDLARDLRNKQNEIVEAIKESKQRRLGGPSPRQRSQKAIKKAIGYVRDRIREAMPEFGTFLDRNIIYKNDPPDGPTVCYSPPSPAPNWLL